VPKRSLPIALKEPYVTGRTHLRVGLAVAALAITLAACAGAQAQGWPDDVAFPSADETQNSAGAGSQWTTTDRASDSVVVNGDPSHSELWADFRRTVADASVPSCFSSDAQSHEALLAEGLLRMPILLGAAANGTCR
jgi:hypothetical protein